MIRSWGLRTRRSPVQVWPLVPLMAQRQDRKNTGVDEGKGNLSVARNVDRQTPHRAPAGGLPRWDGLLAHNRQPRGEAGRRSVLRLSCRILWF